VLRNNLIVAFRNLLKNRIYSVINLVGLSIGISVFVIVFTFIEYEKRFDQFHVNKRRIVRVQQDRFSQGEKTEQTVAACLAAGPALKEALPEVLDFVRISMTSPIVLYNGQGYKEERACFASSSFFKIFTFPLSRGNDSLVLKDPYTAVISESLAAKIFKGEDPVGKAISYRGAYEVEITGVFRDMPQQSHIQLNLIISFATFERQALEEVIAYPWRYDGYQTYLLLDDNSDLSAIEGKFADLIATHTGEWLSRTRQQMVWHLQPLLQIHLYSGFENEFQPNGDHKNVFYLFMVAVFIIVIAWFNYISLATAKSLERAKEVGIRKVLGSYRMQLVAQFLAESFVLNVMAASIAIVIAYLLQPYFSELTGRPIVFSARDTNLWLTLAAVATAGSIGAGIYPAFVLSAFQPALILKGKFMGSASGRLVRKVMVLAPFITAIILVSCLLIIKEQISFLRRQQLGFDLEQKLVVRDSEVYDSSYSRRLATFKNELNRIPGVRQSTYVSVVPGEPIVYAANSVRRLKADKADVNLYKRIWVDEHFIEVYGLTLLAGRNFTTESPPRKALLVNELASRTLGFRNPEEAVDEKIIFMEDTATVVGVVNNFHHESPKDPMAPVIYGFRPDGGLFYIIPVETSTVRNVVAAVEGLFQQVFPGQPFEFFFLDERYNNQYKLDVQFGKVIGVLSVLLVAVTGLGLFGLSAYTTSSRTKEIGIRKVLGATEGHIMAMLCREYFVLIAVAAVIAIPCSWYTMSIWLDSFANRIAISLWMFLLPAIFIALITLIIISFQTIKAAVTDPVTTLHHD